MRAKGPVRAEGTVGGGRAPSDGTEGAQRCTQLVEPIAGAGEGTVMGHRRRQAQGAGMGGGEAFNPRGL